jgi:group II intron reverse transcriptase/maturase
MVILGKTLKTMSAETKRNFSDDERVRILQRKLYQKAKQESEFKFYILYDKISVPYFLREAYRRLKANNGSAGIDGVSFSQIEKAGLDAFLLNIQEEVRTETYKPSAVKRVYIPKSNGKLRPLGIPTIKDRVVQMACKLVIEPLFEADFHACSYGFRPKRSAEGAIKEIRQNLKEYKVEVFDADLSGYFDTIPHRKLMILLKERISDPRVLRLIGMWLKVPIVEVDERGKKRVFGGKRNKVGTPQGGVISPLLANIYLNLLDRIICKKDGFYAKKGIKIVRYADDFVIMGRHLNSEVLERIISLLTRMGLTLNEGKSRMIDARKKSFDFLGFTFRYDKVFNSKCYFWNVIPSRKSKSKLIVGLKSYLKVRSHLPIFVIVKGLNEKLRGWLNYFTIPKVCRMYQTCYVLRSYLKYRLKIWFKRKSQRKCRLYRQNPYDRLVNHFGLQDVLKYAFIG